MELKQFIARKAYNGSNSSNRTFMELKHKYNEVEKYTQMGVLIVPLWNWNSLHDKLFPSSDSSNRTFMELKLWYSSSKSLGTTVLIVPLWNWNPLATVKPKYWDIVLIVPLWNWNPCVRLTMIANPPCSNRTFMELKQWWAIVGARSGAGSNRTFMELKRAYRPEAGQGSGVLIVPLWNWNNSEVTRYFMTRRSNRTFMELKPSLGANPNLLDAMF